MAMPVVTAVTAGQQAFLPAMVEAPVRGLAAKQQLLTLVVNLLAEWFRPMPEVWGMAAMEPLQLMAVVEAVAASTVALAVVAVLQLDLAATAEEVVVVGTVLFLLVELPRPQPTQAMAPAPSAGKETPCLSTRT